MSMITVTDERRDAVLLGAVLTGAAFRGAVFTGAGSAEAIRAGAAH